MNGGKRKERKGNKRKAKRKIGKVTETRDGRLSLKKVREGKGREEVKGRAWKGSRGRERMGREDK